MNSLDYLSREKVIKAIDKRIRDLDNSIHSRVKNAQLQLRALRKEITEMDSIGWKGHEEAKSSVADLLAMQKTIGDDYSGICGKAARKANPMCDKQISELVYDVLCLIYSCDWYLSGDTGEERYFEDVQFFKKKWLKIKPEDAARAEIDKSVSETKDELYKNFGISMDEKEKT